MSNESNEVLKVRKDTDVNRLCNSIIAVSEKFPNEPIIMRAIGAGAVNQAVKGAILSNSYFAKKGMSVSLVPSFKAVPNVGSGFSDKAEISAIEFRVHLQRT